MKRLEIDFVESFDKNSITDELRRIARVAGRSSLSKREVNVHGRLRRKSGE
jgi:hypothetical protein